MADETLLNRQSNNETIYNPAAARNGETMYNPEATRNNAGATMYNGAAGADGNATMYNAVASSGGDATMLNTAVASGNELSSNQVVNGYKIIEKLQISSGEADLYLCEADGNRYVLKLYRRETALKEDILETLKEIDSPYVAKLIATGTYDKHPYEVSPYYERGSILNHINAGKRYTLEELRTIIVPELNEALKELHSRNIVHKDLKPSNIMLQENDTDVAIIDFGISSIKEDGNTIILTRTGFTPDYTAHEAFNGLFLNESDYYSLGITIYELYTGTTPYRNMSPEEIELYTSVQKIPLPDDMEEELKDLISALTYYDITNRKEKSNPNRRWTYEEVKKWCDGEKQQVPGTVNYSKADEQQPQGTWSFIFKGEEYSDRHKLAIAFAKDWDDAKKVLFNGMLSAKFMAIDQEFANTCLDAEEAYGTAVNSDVLFFRVLYKLDPTLSDFIWKGHHYNSLESFGKEVQDKLWHYKKPDMSVIDDVLKNRVLSEYLRAMGTVADEMVQSIGSLEISFNQYIHNKRTRLTNYYLMGYLLSGRKIFFKNNHEFDSVESLVMYMQELLQNSYGNFESYCMELIDDEGNLDAQLETWLLSLGKQDQISVWKSRLA